MDFPALKEAEGRLDAKRAELAALFAEAGPDMDMDKVKSVSGDSAAKVAHIRSLNEEMESLAKDVDEKRSLFGIANSVGGDPRKSEPGSEPDGQKATRQDGQRKSLGELFTGSHAYKGRQGRIGPEAHLDLEVKTLFETGVGWEPETTRTGRVVDFATRPVQITDLIPQGTTSQAAVVYMEETTFTNAAAETAEGSAYAEAALELTEKNSPVRKLAVYLPVTDEQMEDESQARGYVNNRLPFMLRQRLDGQIINGNGTAPNLTGLLNVSGIQTQAKGTDPVADAVFKAMTKVQTTGRAMPGAIIMNPTDWQGVRLLRTADGIYIWGSPSEAGPARMWGLPVAVADVIGQGSALVGDFANFSELSIRRGIDVQVSNSHADYFINGKQAVRADMRAALVVYRPGAFCEITGL